MKKRKLTATALAAGMVMFAGGAVAHEPGALAGTPVCTESNLMAADAQNAPFSNTAVNAAAGSAGRVLEMNITTGERGITVNTPFAPDNLGTPICDNGGVTCELGPGGGVGGPFGDGSAPWKPTGVLSGGQDGHAMITSAAQHAVTEFHRNGTPIRTASTLPTSPSPNGGNFGFVPRLLGSGYMPNGNVAQTVCDANFFNASNSDPMGDGESGINYNAPPGVPIGASTNSSYLYFPPVYSTETRGANGRVLVYDQDSLEVVDEYSKPTSGPYANDPRWTCPAGVIFTSEGLFISMFHGDAVFVVDWKAGLTEGRSTGTGSNSACHTNKKGKENCFKLDDDENEAVVLRVIDLSNDGGEGSPGDALNYDDAPDFDSPNRRDNLRAIRMSEDGTLWGTRRSRSRECVRGEAPMAVVPNPSGNPPCNPGVFRQHIFAAGPGEHHRTGSLALDPGVNVIAGVTINRMSGPGCAFVQAEAMATNGFLTGDECDVETLYAGASAANPGCVNGPGHPANQCFKPGGAILEYRIDAAHMDGASGSCTGNPADGYGPGEGNEGCAMPIAVFDFVSDGTTSNVPDGDIETIDPRMVMTIHEAFVQ